MSVSTASLTATALPPSTTLLASRPTLEPTPTAKRTFRNLQEVTTGFWYRFYKGPAGTIQWGAQAEFIRKNTWAGTTTNNATTTPKGSEAVVLTSFRYVLP